MAVSLAEGLYQKIDNDKIDFGNINMRIAISITFGTVLFILCFVKGLIYILIIFKMDLKNNQNIIKKGIIFLCLTNILYVKSYIEKK